MLYDWLKAFHVIAVIAWMAGMLYLPRLFVYHCDAQKGSIQSETFKIMERRLLKAIMTPAMIVTWAVSLTATPNTACRPLLICSAPTPSEAATPKAVATTASTLNSPPMARTGLHGSDPVTVLISGLPPRRYWKKAIASATTLYTAQGWMPQWKNT